MNPVKMLYMSQGSVTFNQEEKKSCSLLND